MRNLGRTSKTTRKVSALNLERELRAAPVTAVLVVLDLVVRLEAEPVRDRAVGQSPRYARHIPVPAHGLRQLDLSAERLLRRLHG